MSAPRATEACVNVVNVQTTMPQRYATQQFVEVVSLGKGEGFVQETKCVTILLAKEARELAARLIRAADFIDSTPAPGVTP